MAQYDVVTDNLASCERLTGAYGDPASCSERDDGNACLWGRGSLAYFDEAPEIARYAWWSGRPKCMEARGVGGVRHKVSARRVSSCKSAGIFLADGTLTPIGRAYLAHGGNPPAPNPNMTMPIVTQDSELTTPTHKVAGPT